ncbi:MAG: BlaI/MecI/CopY family transcriptional regulator [Aestuariibacter sp.]
MDISKTELEVMQVIWGNNPVSSAEVVILLNEKREWHEKTVKTLLGRLVKKQALSYSKDGKKYLYSPLISEKAYQQKESTSFISRLFRGRVSPLVAGFAKQEKLSRQDIEELKQVIENWEKDND